LFQRQGGKLCHKIEGQTDHFMSFHYCALTVIVKCCVYWLARGMSHWQLQTGPLLVKLTVMFNGDQWLWTVFAAYTVLIAIGDTREVLTGWPRRFA